MEWSPLAIKRRSYIPKYPSLLNEDLVPNKIGEAKTSLTQFFSKSKDFPFLEFIRGKKDLKKRKCAVFFSGGPAPGGHNVLAGLYNGLKKSGSTLVGVLDGPKGLLDEHFKEIHEEALGPYLNQGGFDFLGSGRHKIEKKEDLEKAYRILEKYGFHSLFIIGGDDSHTNAALLAEYILNQGSKITINAIPKTIDGDLRHSLIPISFGYDTATRVYRELVGNLERDAFSAKKYYYFIRLMGRSASHITLDVALNTQPNLTFISEEIKEKEYGLEKIVEIIAEVVEKRSAHGKNYGVILFPEGVIESIPDFSLPEIWQKQMEKEKDPHGNISLSKIETERFFIQLVSEKLKDKVKTFQPVPFFFGYEGRCALPSNFDCCFAYALGKLAAILAENELTGYSASFIHLGDNPDSWKPVAIPIASLVAEEKRQGELKPVVTKTLVDLHSDLFQKFLEKRNSWVLEDSYLQPGPMTFEGIEAPLMPKEK